MKKSTTQLIFTLLVTCLIIAFSTTEAQATGKNWVILVAGSNNYYNYRHQSDVYHAYQVFARTNIPKEQIIVMHYDDIAYNSQNPLPGTVINEPNGPNNYVGVPKDYTKDEVTPENFLAVLSGKDMGPGRKTVKSGPNDRIFVFFSDHGAPGLIAFPSDELYATDLIATIQNMYNNKQYKEMVFYIEACESGSMFNGLLKDEWNVYATTAANPYESSYACYESNVYQTYLADCYSVDFLLDTESRFKTLAAYTFQQQYEVLKKQVTTSHVCQYGTQSIASETLSVFFNQTTSSFPMKVKRPSTANAAKMSSRDVKERYLTKMAKSNPEFAKQLKEYKQEQLRSDIVFGAFSHAFELHKVREQQQAANEDHCMTRAIDAVCMKKAALAMKKHCGSFNESNIKYASYLRDACSIAKVDQIDAKLKDICNIVKL